MAWPRDAKRHLADASASTLYAEVDWREPGVLIVGGETEGARETAKRSGVQTVAIPLRNEVESLNAAVAASVIFFRLDFIVVLVPERNQMPLHDWTPQTQCYCHL